MVGKQIFALQMQGFFTFMGKHFESYKDALDYLTKYLNEVKINEK